MSAAFAVVLTSLVGLGIVYPLLPFLALDLGATPLMVATLLAVDTLVVLLLAPLWGHLSDLFGRRPLILGALALSTLSYPLLLAADGYAVLLLSRMLAGAGLAAIPVLTAYVADRTGREARVAGMAGVNAAYSLAFVIGPLITLLTYDSASGDIRAPVLLACASGGLALLLAGYGLEAAALPGQNPGWRAMLSRRSSLRQAACAAPLAAITVLALVYAVVDGTLGVWARATLSWDADRLALAFLVTGAAAGATQMSLVAPGCRRFGERAVACAAGLAMLGGLCLLSLAPGSAGVFAAMALLGAGLATGCSCLTSLISKAAPAGAQGAVMGLTQSAMSLARIVGPIWGGFALQELGLSWPYASAAALLAVAVLLMAAPPSTQTSVPPQGVFRWGRPRRSS